MPTFSIDTEVYLGISHSGEVTTDGAGTVELTEEEVQQLIALIRENDGETDIEKLKLEEKYPEIFETLDEAFRDAASAANYREWLMEGFECNYFNEPDDFMEAVEEAGLFKFEPTPEQLKEFREDMDLNDEDDIDPEELEEYFEDEKNDAFYEFVSKYYGSLDEDGKVDFIERFYGDVMEDGGPGDYDYEVHIPDEIIQMARNKQ